MDTKTNKKTKSIIAVYAIIAFVYVLAFLIIPFQKSAASWISFAFTVISFPCGVLIYNIAFRNGEALLSKVYGYPIFRIGAIYTITQVIFSIIICTIATILTVPYWIALLLSIIILAASAIGVIATDNARDIVEEIDRGTKQSIQNTKMFNLNIAAIVNQCTDVTLKKELEKLSEQFRFSDPISNSKTESIESDILKELKILEASITEDNAEETLSKIIKIRNLLSERNRICKAEKNT